MKAQSYLKRIIQEYKLPLDTDKDIKALTIAEDYQGIRGRVSYVNDGLIEFEEEPIKLKGFDLKLTDNLRQFLPTPSRWKCKRWG